MVNELRAVIDKAATVLDQKIVAKLVADVAPVEEFQRAAVAKAYGDSFVKDKSAEYVKPLFDAIEANVKNGNGIRALGDALSRPGHRGGSTDTRDAAFGEHLNYLHSAWKGPQKQAS